MGAFRNTSGAGPEAGVVCEKGRTSSPLSDAISADLKKRGMKFVGTTIIYAYLQAGGSDLGP